MKIGKNGVVSNQEITEYCLPQEYQQVEYIESSGTQYIDTDWIPDYHYDMEVDVLFTPTVSNARYILLSNYNGSPFTSIEVMNNQFKYYYNNASVGYTVGSISITDLNKAVYKYINNGSVFYEELNGVSSTRTEATTSIDQKTMFMFLDQLKRTTTFNNPLRICNTKIFQNNKMLRNYVSCYRKSDSEIGMYDLITKTFFTNSGTGTFTKGNDINNVRFYNEKILTNEFIEI